MGVKYKIFTDGGISQKKSISCGGAFLLEEYDNTAVVKSAAVKICENSTNNEAELFGIFKGLELVEGNNLVPYTLYSDSEYSIKSITEWVFNWFKSYTCKRENSIIIPKMMTGGNTEVKNCELICMIINLIVEKQINIRFRHVKGHINPESDRELLVQSVYYRKANKEDIDLEIAKNLSRCNEMIDSICSYHIERYLSGVYDNIPKKEITPTGLFYSGLTSIDIRKSYRWSENERYNKYFMLNKAIMNEYTRLIGGN